MNGFDGQPGSSAIEREPSASVQVGRAAALAGLILWLIFTVVIVILKFDLSGGPSGVVSIYRAAADRWLAGESLYAPPNTFLYMPTAAALASPMSWMPFAIAGAVWRAANLLIFFAGVRAFVRSQKWSLDVPRSLLLYGITAWLAWSAGRHGQSTLAMAGLLMLAQRDLLADRPWRGAIWGSFAVALKTLALGPLAVLLLIKPRAILPCVVVGAVLVVALISPAGVSYTIEQYRDYPDALQRFSAMTHDRFFPQLVTLVAAFGGPGDGVFAGLLRVVFFGVMAGGVVLGANRLNPRSRDVTVYGVLVAALLLASPVTESNTYAALAPALAIVFLNAVQTRSRWEMILAGSLILGFMLDYQLGEMYGRLTKPACALVFCGWMWWRCASAAIGRDMPALHNPPAVRDA